MRVKVVFLPDYLLVFSLLRHRGVEIFLNQKKKMKISNGGNPLNNSIIVYIYIYIEILLHSIMVRLIELIVS